MTAAALAVVFLAGVILVCPDLLQTGALRRRWAAVSAARPGRVRGTEMRSARRLRAGGTCLVAGLAGGALSLAVVPVAGIAIASALACARIPAALARRRVEGLRLARRRAWPEAVDLLASAVRAGETLPAALASLAERGPGPLRSDLGTLVADHRLSGDLGGALRRLAAALGDPAADRFAVTLGFAYRAGGTGLGQVLRALAVSLREDLALRAEITARQSWTVVAARVAAAAPWLVLVIVASRPAALAAYRSSAGAVVLVGGAAATFAGFRVMLSLGRVPEEPRLFAGGAGR